MSSSSLRLFERPGLNVQKTSYGLDPCLRDWLHARIKQTDDAFPSNQHLRFEKGELILRPVEKQAEPEGLSVLEQFLAERLKPISLLDVLTKIEQWLNWSRFFGPLSGHARKLEDAVARYVALAFCYGCNLGPSQTARSLAGVERRDLSWVNRQKSVALAHLGRYEQALTAIDQSIELDPTSAPIYNLKGMALTALGRQQEALSALDQAIRLDSTHVQAHFGKGLVLYQLGNLQEAVFACEQTIRLDPTHARAHFIRGTALCLQGEFQEALVALEQAIKFDPTNVHRYSRLRDEVLAKLGR